VREVLNGTAPIVSYVMVSLVGLSASAAPRSISPCRNRAGPPRALVVLAVLLVPSPHSLLTATFTGW
jgi:hypothetical protein